MENVKQLMVFALVGMVLVSLDLSLFFFLTSIAVSPSVASMLSFILVGAIGYFAHLRVTFRKQSSPYTPARFAAFVGVNVLTVLAMHFSFIGFLAAQEWSDSWTLAMRAFIIGVGSGIRFIVYRWWVYRRDYSSPKVEGK